MNDTYITFTGWVGTTPELRVVGDGQPVTTFRVGSTPRRRKGEEWVNGPTSWFQVKAWRRLAEHTAATLHTGEPVLVHGRLVADVWEREDGTTVTQHVVVATSVGHDLVHGTASFSRDLPGGAAPAVDDLRDAESAGRSVEQPAATTEPRRPAA